MGERDVLGTQVAGRGGLVGGGLKSTGVKVGHRCCYMPVSRLSHGCPPLLR